MLGTVIGAGAAALVGAAGYQSMAPRGQWYGRTFVRGHQGSKQIALTYDDGPNDPHTPRLLEVLAKYGAHATFFLIGRFVEQRPDIVREIVKAGHAIGNHTFNHPRLIFTSPAQTRGELEQCQSAIASAAGQEPKLFRPPFGGRRPDTLRIVRAMGLEPVMWSITGFDWTAPPAERIVRRVSRHIRGGDVVLLHDGSHLGMGGDRAQTVIATERILAQFAPQGYRFIAVPEMMNAVSCQPSAVRQKPSTSQNAES
jgi:peptidoglycan/xylan/chitin deacetylase (PgdA/CDA1 family)